MVKNNGNVNLDVLINKISYDIAIEANDKKVKNELDKLLGILINDGVYAYYIFCKSKKNKVEEVFINNILKNKEGKKLIELLGLNLANENEKDNIEKFFQELPKDLDKLLLFRSVLERILIYARYHLKALENNGGNSA